MTVTVMASLISAPSVFARVPHLRDYQAAIATGLLAGIGADRGATFTVMFPRQAGKNEVAARGGGVPAGGHDDYVASLGLCLRAAVGLGAPRVAMGWSRG